MRSLDSEIDSLMDEWMDGCGRILRDLTVQRKFLFFFFRAKFCVATRLMKFIFSLQKVSLARRLEYMQATKGPYLTTKNHFPRS